MTTTPMTPDEVNRFLAEKLFRYDGKNVPDDWRWWLTDDDGNRQALLPDWFHDAGLVHRDIIPAMRKLNYNAIVIWQRDGIFAQFTKRRPFGSCGFGESTDVASSAVCLAAVEALKGEGANG